MNELGTFWKEKDVVQEFIDGKMIKAVKSFAITFFTVSLYKHHHFVGETTNAQARWTCSKSIFSNDQYVTIQKYFLHLSLVIWFFPTPPIKLKLVLQIGGRLLIANHLDKSLLLTNQNHYYWPIKTMEQQSYHIYFTLLSEVWILPASANFAKILCKFCPFFI